MNDDLGDRMKFFERATDSRLMPLLPVLARIDGRAFHSFTRGMARPFDAEFNRLMVETTKYLVKETNACMGYTQSDEITLAWHSTDANSQIWFDGRLAKMTSQLAAHATLWFNRILSDSAHFGRADRLPTFDARVWTVPNRAEGANVFLWREWDATKNSISMAASVFYSPRALYKKNGNQMQEMLLKKGVNWNDYPASFKRGTFIQRRTTREPFTASDLAALPPRHNAHRRPGLIVERSTITEIAMPIFTTVTNREAVVFAGEEPEVKA